MAKSLPRKSNGVRQGSKPWFLIQAEATALAAGLLADVMFYAEIWVATGVEVSLPCHDHDLQVWYGAVA